MQQAKLVKKRLQRKQARRIILAKKSKTKLGKNFNLLTECNKLCL